MTVHRYPTLAILLHWLNAVLLIGSFALGLRMVGMDFSPEKINSYAYHKWLGVTIFGVVVVRCIYRQFKPPPALPSDMAEWQKIASRLSHRLLYLLLFVLPLSTFWTTLIAVARFVAKRPRAGQCIEASTLCFNATAVGADFFAHCRSA